MRNFADIFRNAHFLCETICICFQEQSVVGALKVLAKSLKTAFD